MKGIISSSASVLALLTTPAAAQTAPARPVTSTDNAPSGAAPSSVCEPSSVYEQSGLEDVIVTALRTEQTAQKTPLAIVVIKPEECAST